MTFGVFVDSLGDPYVEMVLRGLSQGANNAGATLLVFVGGALLQTGDVTAPKLVYEYATEHHIEGLVTLSSTLIHNVGPAGLEQYCKKFSSMPIMSVGLALPGIPSITVDNTTGVRHLVRHLVREHKATAIACIRGPLANAEAELRTKAYRDTMVEEGLQAPEQWVIEGDFTAEGGRRAVDLLAKVCNLHELHAIIANNDSMALGAIERLTELGFSVPHQIAVAGFDNIDDAALIQPPLTTISQPVELLGRKAIREVIALAQHRVQPDDNSLPTELIVRRSCGCSSIAKAKRLSIHPPSSRSLRTALLFQQDKIGLEMLRASRGGFGLLGNRWEGTLLHCFFDALGDDPNKGEEFLSEFQLTAERLGDGGADLEALSDVLDVMRRKLVPILREDTASREVAADLMHRARTLLHQVQMHRLSTVKLNLERYSRTLALACNAVSGVFGHAELAQVLRGQLAQLSVRSCFLATYLDPNKANTAQLLVAYDCDTPCESYEGHSFDSAELLPPGLASAGTTSRSYSVHPLQREGIRLGHLLIALEPESLLIARVLTGAVAGSLYGAHLLRRH